LNSSLPSQGGNQSNKKSNTDQNKLERDAEDRFGQLNEAKQRLHVTSMFDGYLASTLRL
jgi:hypothetical protein